MKYVMQCLTLFVSRERKCIICIRIQAEQSQSVLKVGSMGGYDVMTIGDPLDQDIKLVSKVIGIFCLQKTGLRGS